MKRPFLLTAFVAALLLFASQVTAQPAGLGEGVGGELQVVSEQLVALAEAIPGDKYNWRPREGVQSVAEVFLHTATTNFWLLRQTGVEPPAGFDLAPDLANAVSPKAEVIAWLKASVQTVRQSYAAVGQGEKTRGVRLFNRDTTVEGVYIRTLAHMNQHMGQAVAYARVLGVTPPWSR